MTAASRWYERPSDSGSASDETSWTWSIARSGASSSSLDRGRSYPECRSARFALDLQATRPRRKSFGLIDTIRWSAQSRLDVRHRAIDQLEHAPLVVLARTADEPVDPAPRQRRGRAAHRPPPRPPTTAVIVSPSRVALTTGTIASSRSSAWRARTRSALGLVSSTNVPEHSYSRVRRFERDIALRRKGRAAERRLPPPGADRSGARSGTFAKARSGPAAHPRWRQLSIVFPISPTPRSDARARSSARATSAAPADAT